MTQHTEDTDEGVYFRYDATADGRETAGRVLSTWGAVETLSPRTYGNPKELVEGVGTVMTVTTDDLPWHRHHEPRPGAKTYYRVDLGGIDMRPAGRAVLETYGSDEGASSPKGSYAVLAMLLADEDGAPVASGFSVSSFAWALPLALGKDLSGMARWAEVEHDLLEALSTRLCKDDPERPGKLRPLRHEDVATAHQWLVTRLAVPASFVTPPSFAIRFEHRSKGGSVPPPYMLNSFLLDDIERVRKSVGKDETPRALAAYLGITTPRWAVDVLAEHDTLRDLLYPGAVPPARWPAPGGHGLVTLQQAAVNVAWSDLSRTEGVLAVNGPPGTGKTTMIRDLVAGAVLSRAVAMAAFEDPERAFEFTPTLKPGRRITQVARSLRGHEILVASSNNKAVENVSRELPLAHAVQAGTVPGYFKATSDYLAGIELGENCPPPGPGEGTWGLVAAVLGNAANRSAFLNGFWWDDDHGMRTRLRVAEGGGTKVPVKDRSGLPKGERETLLPKAEDIPRGKSEALGRWRATRARFLALEQEVGTELARLGAYERARLVLPVAEESARIARETVERARSGKRPAVELAERMNAAETALEAARRAVRDHAEAGADAADRGAVVWQVEADEFASRVTSAEASLARLVAALAAESERGEDDGGVSDALKALDEAEAQVTEARDVLTSWTPGGDVPAVDAAFFESGHETWNKATPWLTPGLQAKRARLFGLAMEVHRDFLLAAARPAARNLMAFAEMLGGSGSPEVVRNVESLWATLFLFVPVVSTTFASVGRMMGGLPAGSLGWLVVDEAGQAVPQAAVGALSLARRAVFVGDPLQVEPVTTLPSRLTLRVCEHFGVEYMDWMAPETSAQNLADRASPLQARFSGADGERLVGMPLLVHRRCQEPMFGISNRIAYDGLMVQAAGPEDPSAPVTARSCWFDVHGGYDGKWSEEEGEVAAAIVSRMATGGRMPDVYVISPFRDVAARLRQRLERVARAFTHDARDWVRDRVGTIHTFQGREARSVILVLGAGDTGHTGARAWASRTPNIANVAVTRAKSRLYVVGSRAAWAGSGSFRTVADRLPVAAPPRIAGRAQAA